MRYPRYVSVAEKKAKAEKKLKSLRKKNPNIRPVTLEGKTLARTWWGKSWNRNLERYADYENRIGRGRSYLRHGAVLDLQITAGKVEGLVLGSSATPYKVGITIKPISAVALVTIRNRCEGNLKSMQDLLAGTFPKELQEVFFAPKRGLFPSPKAIDFACSCPDIASMCKHVAAVLYGIGARFDEDPALFFTLRGVDTAELVSGAVQDQTDKLLSGSTAKSGRVMDDADLADLFGIDMDVAPDFAPQPSNPLSQASPAQPPSPTPPPTTSPPTTKKTTTATDRVAALIITAQAPVRIGDLVQSTGYTKSKLYAIVHRLKGAGVIKNVARGVYTKA